MRQSYHCLRLLMHQLSINIRFRRPCKVWDVWLRIVFWGKRFSGFLPWHAANFYQMCCKKSVGFGGWTSWSLTLTALCPHSCLPRGSFPHMSGKRSKAPHVFSAIPHPPAWPLTNNPPRPPRSHNWIICVCEFKRVKKLAFVSLLIREFPTFLLLLYSLCTSLLSFPQELAVGKKKKKKKSCSLVRPLDLRTSGEVVLS